MDNRAKPGTIIRYPKSKPEYEFRSHNEKLVVIASDVFFEKTKEGNSESYGNSNQGKDGSEIEAPPETL